MKGAEGYRNVSWRKPNQHDPQQSHNRLSQTLEGWIARMIDRFENQNVVVATSNLWESFRPFMNRLASSFLQSKGNPLILILLLLGVGFLRAGTVELSALMPRVEDQTQMW
ncbi:MAG: hypothetical protein KDK97_20990, partial [Verrucomicrobiales bacterium]|nr:hypothetical protein [Verrucomicrobiales bacterium]